ALRRRPSHDPRHHHGVDPPDEPGRGDHVPRHLARDGGAAPPVRAGFSDARRPADRRRLPRGGGERRRGPRGVPGPVYGTAGRRLGTRYVPQGQNISPQLRVEENLQLGAWIARHDRAGVASILERAYATFPRLRERRRRRATSLSGGEAKMLSLAKELVNDPVLLLVDEPSAGLAPRIAPLVHDGLVAARARGVPLLLIDQNITKAA